MKFHCLVAVFCAVLCTAVAQNDSQIVMKKSDDSTYDFSTDQIKWDSGYCKNCRFGNSCTIIYQEDVVKAVWHVKTPADSKIASLTSTCQITLDGESDVMITANQTISGEDEIRKKDADGNIPNDQRIEVYASCSVKDQNIDDKKEGKMKICLNIEGGDNKWCMEAPVTVYEGNSEIGSPEDDE